ncbi:hypothetical protein [Neolewinella antarctica]|uniref:Uncharacterized protein n=1 Tax=Neolewinella antarctica TaxID=442734 RepID=A0ABX0XC95_9BACT|nr:hypothetical protein [Neolewinella antarctica]NJC26705.1 hypothetical protein [Neolewinella antarctica]
MKYFSFLLALVLFTACGDKSISSEAELEAMEASRVAQESAYENMVAAHDRIMPKMGEVTAAQRAIKEQLEDENLPEDRVTLLEAAYEQLEDANDGMMEWMQDMKPLAELRESMDNDAITAHIRDESSEIAGVEANISTAVAMAKELVGDHSGHVHGAGEDHGHNH